MFCRLRTFLLTLQPSAQLADSSRCSSPLLESHIMKPLGVANQAHICDILMLSLQCAPSAIVSAPTLMLLTGEGKHISDVYHLSVGACSAWWCISRGIVVVVVTCDHAREYTYTTGCSEHCLHTMTYACVTAMVMGPRVHASAGSPSHAIIVNAVGASK